MCVFVCEDVGWDETTVHSAVVWYEISVKSQSESSWKQQKFWYDYFRYITKYFISYLAVVSLLWWQCLCEEIRNFYFHVHRWHCSSGTFWRKLINSWWCVECLFSIIFCFISKYVYYLAHDYIVTTVTVDSAATFREKVHIFEVEWQHLTRD